MPNARKRDRRGDQIQLSRSEEAGRAQEGEPTAGRRKGVYVEVHD